MKSTQHNTSLEFNNNKITDDFIIKLFYCKNRINSNYTRDEWFKNHQNIVEYLNNRYVDSVSIYETLYRIKNHIDVRPKCVICGNDVRFNKEKHRFNKHCSKKCSAQDNQTKIKHKLTCLKKYGVSNYAKTDECKNKAKETCLKKYGTTCYPKTDEYKEKYHNRCETEFGVSSYFKTDEFKNKSRKTCLKKIWC